MVKHICHDGREVELVDLEYFNKHSQPTTYFKEVKRLIASPQFQQELEDIRAERARTLSILLHQVPGYEVL